MKGNTKLIIGILIGILISFITVEAAAIINSNSILYDNSTGLESTNVQDAIDELFGLSENMGNDSAFWKSTDYTFFHNESGTTNVSNFYLDVTLPKDMNNNIALIYTDRQKVIDTVSITTVSGDVEVKEVENFSNMYQYAIDSNGILQSPVKIYTVTGTKDSVFRIKQDYTSNHNNRNLSCKLYNNNSSPKTEYKGMINATKGVVSGQTVTFTFEKPPLWIIGRSSRGVGDYFYYNIENGTNVTHMNDTNYASSVESSLVNRTRGYYNQSGGNNIEITGTTLVLKYLDGSQYAHIFYYGY